MHASATRFRAPRALEPPARASSRRRRVVVARRARNFNNPADPARSAVVAPALGATDAESEPAAEPFSRAAPAAVVAGVAAAALLAHASPALGADTAFEASARAAGVEGPLGESIVAASPQSLFYASPRAPRPTVDAGAHERYVNQIRAAGVEPGEVVFVGGAEPSAAPRGAGAAGTGPAGLDRFGSAATSADETASLFSTAAAVAIAAALGSSSGGTGGTGSPGGPVKKPPAKKPATNASRKLKTSAKKYSKVSVLAPRKAAPSALSSKGTPTPYAATAVAALGATAVVTGIAASTPTQVVAPAASASASASASATATVTATAPAATAFATAAEADAAAAALAAGAVVLGTAATVGNKKTGTVRSNIVAYGKPPTAPPTKLPAKTRDVRSKKPPPPPPPPAAPKPGTFAPKRDPPTADETSSGSPAAAIVLALGVGIAALTTPTTPTTVTPPPPPKGPTTPPPEATLFAPAPPPTDEAAPAAAFVAGAGAEASPSDALTPALALILLAAAGATAAGVGLRSDESRMAARRAAEAQRWIDEWKAARASEKEAEKTLPAKQKAAASGPPSAAEKKKTSYYETVGGAKYDRAVLDACRACVDEDGFISKTDAEKIIALVKDGPRKTRTRPDGGVVVSSVTDVELATAAYAAEHFRWTSPAKKWFAAEVAKLDMTEAEANAFEAQAWIDAWAVELETVRALERKAKKLSAEHAAAADDANGESATDGKAASAPTGSASGMKTKKKKKSKSGGASYYETIGGVRYDRAVLDACRAVAKPIDLAAARAVFERIADGPVRAVTRRDGAKVRSAITNVELDTAKYVFETFEWTSDAKTWFAEKMAEEGEKR